MITKALTKHSNFNSPLDSFDSCINCNGLMCDKCQTIWVASDGESFNVEDRAIMYQRRYDTLVPGIIDLNHESFFIKDNILYYHNYDDDIKCNKKSPMYETRIKEAMRCKELYTKCTCTNKNESNLNNDCCMIFGCRDIDCFYEMKKNIRTKKRSHL